ncbi:hypothetical protein PV783_13975 [Chitinophaga sp. CC14]|uniref:hypothetical protein n=1 Tax=Chitinophaga sp. CC14 TaxID=3029199 RepID=UPI003B77EE65
MSATAYFSTLSFFHKSIILKITPIQFQILLDKYLSNKMSDDELKSFIKAVQDPENEAILSADLVKGIREKIYSANKAPEQIEQAYLRIVKASLNESAGITHQKKHKRYRNILLAIGCIVIILLILALIWVISAKAPVSQSR